MRDHPMLLMRDPPPEIDVTRPALPTRTATQGEWHIMGDGSVVKSPTEAFTPGNPLVGPKRIRLADLTDGVTSETVDNTAHGYLDGRFYVVSTPTTIEFTTVMDPNSWSVESAAQPTSIAQTVQRAPAVESVAAADQFKAGDRVMWHWAGGMRDWRAGIYCLQDSGVTICRRPTDAELSLHWPEVVADADGWIEWKGGECPVAFDCEVRIKLVNDEEIQDMGCAIDWNYGDIIAYKVLP